MSAPMVMDVVYQDDDFLVRATNEGKNLKLYVHPKKGGQEHKPESYVLGVNTLIFKGS